MLELHRIRDLSLQHPPQPGRPAHLSAASGLVRAGEFLYVVADDEFHLGVFPLIGNRPGVLLRLKPGELPDAPAARKAAKPDLESLARLGRSDKHPHGALFALGSGSRPNRRRGFVVELAEQGAAIDSPRAVDLSAVYATLVQVKDINIEGAVVDGDRLRLLQRGNKGDGRNAVIELRCEGLAHQLRHQDGIDKVELVHISWFDLGDVQGVPLCFTDGAALADGSVAFTAVAEDTDDNYADGRCVGAAVGIINANGNLQTLRRLARPWKVEGIAARSVGGLVHLLLATDADDPQVPASLYSAQLSRQ